MQNELYSSRVKEFEIRGRQTHPRTEGTDYGKILNSGGWQFLGAFNASNVKGTQVSSQNRRHQFSTLLALQLCLFIPLHDSDMDE